MRTIEADIVDSWHMSGIYLSQRVCKDLGIILESFPRVGEFRNVQKAMSKQET